MPLHGTGALICESVVSEWLRMLLIVLFACTHEAALYGTGSLFTRVTNQ